MNSRVTANKPSGDDLETVKSRVETYYGGLLPTVEACLSVCCSMAFANRTRPLSLMLETTSGYGKSAIVQMFFPVEEQGGLNDYIYRCDKFTPKSFVTHATNVPREKLAEIDLLPQIKDKVLVTKECAPMFRGRDDDLTDIFTILIPVLDGKGFVSNSGVHGKRGYPTDIVFNWLGATTPLKRRTHQLMYQLGTRLLFFEVPAVALTDDQLTEYALRDDASQGEMECRDAVNRFLLRFFSEYPVGSLPPELVEITPTRAEQIVRWARLLTYGRRGIEYERDGRNYVPIAAGTPEGAFKVVDYFKLLARGHAFLHERLEVGEEDIELVSHVAISSIPGYLRPIVRKLRCDGQITSTECARVCSVTQPTARKYVLEACLLGLGDLTKGNEANVPDMLRLSNSFRWLREPRKENVGCVSGVERLGRRKP
jgi:hypothetical protein